MSGLRSTTAAGARPDRNDPCPCGSGLKYKKCCAIRPRSAPPRLLTLNTPRAHGSRLRASPCAVPPLAGRGAFLLRHRPPVGKR